MEKEQPYCKAPTHVNYSTWYKASFTWNTVKIVDFFMQAMMHELIICIGGGQFTKLVYCALIFSPAREISVS